MQSISKVSVTPRAYVTASFLCLAVFAAIVPVQPHAAASFFDNNGQNLVSVFSPVNIAGELNPITDPIPIRLAPGYALLCRVESKLRSGSETQKMTMVLGSTVLERDGARQLRKLAQAGSNVLELRALISENELLMRPSVEKNGERISEDDPVFKDLIKFVPELAYVGSRLSQGQRIQFAHTRNDLETLVRSLDPSASLTRFKNRSRVVGTQERDGDLLVVIKIESEGAMILRGSNVMVTRTGYQLVHVASGLAADFEADISFKLNQKELSGRHVKSECAIETASEKI